MKHIDPKILQVSEIPNIIKFDLKTQDKWEKCQISVKYVAM